VLAGSWRILAGRKVSFDAFNADAERTWSIKDGDVIGYPAEQDDSRLRNAAIAVVDDEVIGAPKSQRSRREMELPLYRWRRRRQIAGLFLTEMVAHLDRERQHLDQGSGRVVVDQLGSNRPPVRR
jgi:hypothetical protein